MIAENAGGKAMSPGQITLTDHLPPGVVADPEGGEAGLFGQDLRENEVVCSSTAAVVTCRDEQNLDTIQPGQSIFMIIPIDIEAGAISGGQNIVAVSGGGAPDDESLEASQIGTAPASFGFLPGAAGFDGMVASENGEAQSQAGSHPYELTAGFTLTSIPVRGSFAPAGNPKDLTTSLPAGVVVNPQATPTKCTETELETDASGGGCPDSSAVGTVTVATDSFGFYDPTVAALYNMVAPPGSPANLGFDALGFGIYVHLLGHVRTGTDYGLSATAQDILQRNGILAASVTLWGDPSAPSHDAIRGACAPLNSSIHGRRCPVTRTATPLLTLPSACSGPLSTTISADSWQEPGKFLAPDDFASHDPFGNPVGIVGCGGLDFSPTITLKPRPGTVAADSPSGLSVDLKISQEESQVGLAEANLKRAIVTLPVGMAVSPSAANGLGACGPGEIGLSDAEKPSCPDSSKVGSTEVITPLLSSPLTGSVYLAQQGNNPFGSLLALYLVAEGSGALIKLAGHVEADPVTGQLTATFDNNPQLPFSELKLQFFGGPRAALVTPAACGTYATTSSLSPWSGTPPATPSDAFAVTTGCGGGFAPSFTAGTSNNQAGGFSPLSVTLSRQDGEQRLRSVQLTTPPGLLGVLKSVVRCPEPQASLGACGPESQIGRTTTGAGPGPDPFYVGGNVFLTGPYKGAPFGLSIMVHALAGPFDLGNVIVRAAINVDPNTAQITVTSDPLPTILQGIPLDLRTVNVTVDRPGFMFNPSNCAPLSVAGTIASTNGANAAVSSPFQAANCANLPFKPAFSASTSGRASKPNGASLNVKITAKPGEANIHKVNLQLPIALPSRLSTLQKACTEAQFNANPAGCPEGSFVGTATAHTPILSVPLTGPAILVSHGGAAFPDVEFVLQGEGVLIILDGQTDIKKGRTYSNFETVPDAPITSFETTLPQGPHSILGAYVPGNSHYNLCGHKLLMPTTITGQNGAVIHKTTSIAITGCPKPHKKHKARKARVRHGHRSSPTRRS